MSKWAEQENVFTRLLPYAVVFGVTDKWAKAFESLGQLPSDTTWYVSSRPFVYAQFADSIDSFAVTTSGTIASTPGGLGRQRLQRRRARAAEAAAGAGAPGRVAARPAMSRARTRWTSSSARTRETSPGVTGRRSSRRDPAGTSSTRPPS